MAARSSFMPFDYSTGYSTGIALMHFGPSPATVTITLFDEARNSLGTPAVVVVSGAGHLSKVLADLFPGIAGKRGTVSLTADLNIFGRGIRTDGLSFTSLKVISK
jgi:hypothetical protein